MSQNCTVGYERHLSGVLQINFDDLQVLWCAPKSKYMHAFTFCRHWNTAITTRNQTHNLLRQPKEGKLSSKLLSIAEQYNIRYEANSQKSNNWFPKPAEAISQMTRAVHFLLQPFYHIKFIPGKETEHFKIYKLPLDREETIISQQQDMVHSDYDTS